MLKTNGASQRCFTGAIGPATYYFSVFFWCLMLLFSSPTLAQQTDKDKLIQIEILPSSGTELHYLQTDSGAINKLIYNVQLRHGDAYMYCDSAYIHLAKNNLQAFGNVRIIQSGTQVSSDYLRYTGNNKLAFLQGNVNLTDGNKNLWTEELYYSVATKIGTYYNGGTLQNESTAVSSNSGYYNARTKDARFTEEVLVTNPSYQVASKDLGYNTATEVVTFFAPSVITNDSAVLHTNGGTWDAKNEIAHFITRSSLQDRAQYIEADSLYYNRKTGMGTAIGKVVCIDTALKATLYSGAAQYNERNKHLYATRFPVMKKMNGNDSIFIRADTFFSAPVISLLADTSFAKNTSDKKKRIKEPSQEATQTAADTTKNRYFIGYHQVVVYSDSLQARCDSISYSQQDSTMRLMFAPIVWSRQAQITGDTILLYMDSSTIKRIFIPNNALLVSLTGTTKTPLYDQVQGNTMTGYFENNAVKELVVYPNAEAIYYSKDDNGRYLGVDETQCDRMKVLFEEKEISQIKQYQNIKHKMTPMQQALTTPLRLSRFQWLADKRPKSLQELWDYGKAEKANDKAEKELIKKASPKNKNASRNSGSH